LEGIEGPVDDAHVTVHNVPVKESQTAERANLRELATGLRELHRGLLEEQRAEYESGHGPVAGGVQLLHLATHEPSFAWLRVLSALMVDLDALLDEDEPPSTEEQGALRRELEELFSPAAPEGFWDRCLPMVQAPHVTMGYARVRAALARLPLAPPPDVAAELHAKHRWAVARRMRTGQ
jgi:hypothetical protein